MSQEKAETDALNSCRFSASEILENISHGIIAVDLQGIIIYWNKGAEELFGYSKKEIIGKKGATLYPESRKNEFKEDIEQLKRGEMITGQWLGRRKDDSWIWLDIDSRMLKDESGNPKGFICSVCDIEPQKKVENELEESRARAKAILESTVAGIITIDTEGIIQSFNKSAEDMFGYKEHELVGKNVSMLMPSPHEEQHDNYMYRYMSTGEKHIIGIGREVRGKRKDGSIFPMELSVSEVTWDHQKIFTGVINDLTEKRALEREIIQISEEEKRRIGQDLHDGLGQMLTGIGLMTQNLAKKMESNGIPGAAQVKEIRNLIQDADEYARTLSHSLTPVDIDSNGLKIALKQLCNRAQKLFDIDCRFSEEGELKIQGPNTSIHLYRIAQEAISNAVKHGRADRVRLELEASDRYLKLKVEDNGIGFEESGKKQNPSGMGVHTMRYRAHVSGGDLNIRETEEGNTLVECTITNFDYS